MFFALKFTLVAKEKPQEVEWGKGILRTNSCHSYGYCQILQSESGRCLGVTHETKRQCP